MPTDHNELLAQALRDTGNGWSVGTFGAVAEFMRDRGEPHSWFSAPGDCTQIMTARGGIRVRSRADLTVLAYNTFPGGGDTWGNEVAFCLPATQERPPRAIRCLGPDREALRPEDRTALLFDVGAGVGAVRFCVRTADRELMAALLEAQGADPLSAAAGPSNALTLKLSPARVAISPLARIEVYAPIPPPGGASPLGPHTHLLPRLVASGRTHSANAPIPAGLQPVLLMHPPSPWRDSAGKPIPYDTQRARRFDALLAQFGLEEDRRLWSQVREAVGRRAVPGDFPAPQSRHGRTQLRVLLRRLAQEVGREAVLPWREVYDSGALAGPHELHGQHA
jgi:hypothetical protein